MELTQSIETMLEEIRRYQGNFGDPIVDCVEFNPIEVLQTGEDNHTIGAGIALLVNFANHVDNATYQDAMTGEAAKAIQQAIDGDFFIKQPTLFSALKSTLMSEKAFNRGLSDVYVQYVQ